MKIGVAISNFMSDNSVQQLVARIQFEQWPIEGIIVVDSLGSGKLEELGVDYYNFDHNLGSAGNLHHRLILASKKNWDFVLALNHDALVKKSTLESFIKYAGIENLGALYPLKFFPDRKIYDLSGTKEIGPWRSFGPTTPPKEELIEHIWSSSNGAFYSLDPVRKGLSPNPKLWMGWEDYLYGLDLKKAGYKQYLVSKAICEDNYEFEDRDLGGLKIKLSSKPAWYHYYRTRNLWLIIIYYHPSLVRFLRIFIRTLAESLAICFGWELGSKSKALKLQLMGWCHGLVGKKGKWKVP